MKPVIATCLASLHRRDVRTVGCSGPLQSWDSLRYDVLLPLTARSRTLGAVYAKICAAKEWSADRRRREFAASRIGRALGVSRDRAQAIFRRALESEAREEAEVRWLMDHFDQLESRFAADTSFPRDGRCIWATLHLGSPILAILYLACVRRLDLEMVGRPLDEYNPMPPAKRGWGRRKVEWLERVTSKSIFGVSAEATAIVRSRVLHGASLFVLMDVPGDAVARSVVIDLFGERMRIAAGVFVLARMLGVPIRPVVAVSRHGRVALRYGSVIEPAESGVPTHAIAREMGTLVRDLADEWWMWPYLPEA